MSREPGRVEEAGPPADAAAEGATGRFEPVTGWIPVAAVAGLGATTSGRASEKVAIRYRPGRQEAGGGSRKSDGGDGGAGT